MRRRKESEEEQNNSLTEDGVGAPKGFERETVIMFVDIMGASEVSNHKSPEDYAKFVNEFQVIFCEVCEKYVNAWYEVGARNNMQYTSRGDEGLLMIYRPETFEQPTVDIDVAINIAFELKRRWLTAGVNKIRISDGLLPVDLAIGIHIGRTFLEKLPTGQQKPNGNPGGWIPEGYAINLAKRVESHSRQGRFTHILLSEAAQGQMNYLTNERTYLFDDPQTFIPKGISREIRVYEIKHFFLPSDWQGESEQSSRAKTLLYPPDAEYIDILRNALKLNPTNLWLAEEYIRSSMLFKFYELPEVDRDDKGKLRDAFVEAKEKARLLGQGDQRDAGVLFIQGLIEGEYGNYDEERRLYEEAIGYREQLAEAFWYKGQSYSMQVYEEGADLSPEKIQEYKEGAICCFRQAKTMRSQAAWMLYDYGCELIQWAPDDQAPEVNEGVNEIVAACHALEDVKSKIKKEPYLKKVRTHPTILKLLTNGN